MVYLHKKSQERGGILRRKGCKSSQDKQVRVRVKHAEPCR